MRKYLFLLTILATSYFAAFAQTSSSQTRTASNVNNLNNFKQVFGDQNFPGARAKNLAADDNRFVSSSRLPAAADSAGPFSSNSFSSLALQNFGFTIPDNATIENVTLTIRRFKTGSAPVGDQILSLMQRYDCNAGICRFGVFWTDQDTYNGKIYPSSETEYEFFQNGSGNDGGINHDEQYQWTPAIINHLFFGVRIDNFPPIGEGYAKIYYDLAKITVVYSEPVTVAAKSANTQAVNPSVEPIIYPNPFTTKANMQFTAAESGKATVEIYDVTGTKVRTLFSGEVVKEQVYNVTIGDAWLPKGVFIYIINNGKRKQTGKIIKLE